MGTSIMSINHAFAPRKNKPNSKSPHRRSEFIPTHRQRAGNQTHHPRTAQERLCKKVIAILADKLAPDGILVFNIHNSSPSFLSAQNCIKNLLTHSNLCSMSRSQVHRLIETANLEIIETKAFGVLPKALHIILGYGLYQAIDRTLAKSKLLQKIGSDVIYVCRRKKM